MLMLSKTKGAGIESKILSCLKKSNGGCSITEIASKTKISRSAIRTTLAKLNGAGKISFRNIGVAKVYFLREGEK